MSLNVLSACNTAQIGVNPERQDLRFHESEPKEIRRKGMERFKRGSDRGDFADQVHTTVGPAHEHIARLNSAARINLERFGRVLHVGEINATTSNVRYPEHWNAIRLVAALH